MKKVVRLGIEKIFTIIFYGFRIFKINNKKIIFSSFNGKGYGENPKYICEEILNRNLPYQLYWCTKKYDSTIPKQLKQIKVYSIKWIYHMVTAKMWISDSRFPEFVKKRKCQYYIQTWHSSLRLKKIEKDVEQSLPDSYIKMAKNDSKMINLITCGSEFSKKTYEESFWYSGPIFMCGTPKFDIYFENNYEKIKNKICDMYNICYDKKIILYAPTFRSSQKNYTGSIDFNKYINNSKFTNYVFLVRLHPEARKKIEKLDNVIDVTLYPNFQDLLISSDILITDYSGCCFDALVLEKPCILYVPDLNEYIQKERNLYFEFEKLPFIITKTSSELEKNILDFNFSKYKKNISLFSKSVGLNEYGEASKLIVDNISEVIDDGKI